MVPWYMVGPFRREVLSRKVLVFKREQIMSSRPWYSFLPRIRVASSSLRRIVLRERERGREGGRERGTSEWGIGRVSIYSWAMDYAPKFTGG